MFANCLHQVPGVGWCGGRDRFRSQDPLSIVRTPTRANHSPNRMSLMKMLFSLKNLLASKKSLKSYSWYIWY